MLLLLEYMAGQLASYGYTITEDPDVADLWLLNSCTVKNPAQDHFVNEVTKARDHGKHLVVAGCVPQAAPSHKALKGVSIIGVSILYSCLLCLPYLHFK